MSDFEAVPNEMKKIDSWVLWKLVDRQKLPYQLSGSMAKSNDPSTWTNFENVKNSEKIGFVFDGTNGIIGIDLDNCILPDNRIKPWAMEIINSLNSYTEISPSGTGIKIFAKAKIDLSKYPHKFIIDTSSDKSIHDDAIEIYNCGRYFTVTGHAISDIRVLNNITIPLSELLKSWQERYSKKLQDSDVPNSENIGDLRTARKVLKAININRCNNYEEWLKIGQILHSVCAGQDGLELWDKWSKNSSKYLKGDCASKWQSFAPDRGLTIGTLIKWAKEDTPNFEVSDRVDKSKNLSLRAFAIEFLNSKYRLNDEYILKYYERDKTYYLWTGTHYVEREKDSIKNELIRFLPDDTTIRFANDILAHITSLISLGRVTTQYLSFKNGLLNLEEYINNCDSPLLPHTPKVFNFNCLPYDFNKNAKCPMFQYVLSGAQPDREVQNLIQEWAGYCLTHDTSFNKFMIWFGEGANGKSTVMKPIHLMLGEANVSGLDLNELSNANKFYLEDCINKLANFSYDTEKVDKSDEGIIKKWTGGEPIMINRKFKSVISYNPTSKLLFSCNEKPMIHDKSNGIWRRLLLVPFNIIIDKTNEIRELADLSYWKKKDEELSGIFNWAIDGLRRLRKNSHFTEPASVEAAKEKYKLEVNPTKCWILENCKYEIGQKFYTKTLYLYYRQQMLEQGNQPLSDKRFATEVKRIFPGINISQNLETIEKCNNTERSRVYYNLSTPLPVAYVAPLRHW